MRYIKTATGKTQIKTKALYLGAKRIDKDIAEENLRILKRVLDKKGLKTPLAYGTLLGVIRDNDFITHDEDIDLIAKSEDKQAFFNSLPELEENGFDVVRYDRRGLVSVMRKGEYIDIYFFQPDKDGLRYCSGCYCPAEFLDNIRLIHFKDNDYWIPDNYEAFLVFIYGYDWKTPIQYNNYNMPVWKKGLFCIKEHVKTLLPDFVYFYMARKASRKKELQYVSKLERYRNYVKEQNSKERRPLSDSRVF